MHKSKFLALLLAVAMVVSMVVVPAYATGEFTLKLLDENDNNTITAEPGDEITLYMKIENTPGLISVGADVSFSAPISLTDVTDTINDVWKDSVDAMYVGDLKNNFTSPFSVVYASSGDANFAGHMGEGKFATLTFKVADDAQNGTYTIEMDPVMHNSDGDFNVVTPVCKEFKVTVSGGEEPAGSECPVCGESFTWTEVKAADWANGAALSGHYKLVEDVAPTTTASAVANAATAAALTVAEGRTVCIDLNGHNITAGALAAASDVSYRVFYNEGTLSIMDKTAAEVEGVYTAGIISGGAMKTQGDGDYKALGYGGNVCNNGGTFTLHSGIIADGYLTGGAFDGGDNGGNIYSDGGVLNIKGGIVRDGSSQRTSQNGTSQGGGNIYAKDTDVNITGGTISGGRLYGTYKYNNTDDRRSQLRGGNLFVTGGSLEISNATISGGKIEYDLLATKVPVVMEAYGGNVYAYTADVNISNSSITNGLAKTNATGKDTVKCDSFGGNLYFVGATNTLTIDEKSTISGGQAVATGAAAAGQTATVTQAPYGGNIYLKSGTMNMGGTISGGSATCGVGVFMVDGTANVTGTIEDCATPASTKTYLGSGMYIKAGTVDIDGTIQNCSAAYNGSAIYMENGTVTLDGTIDNCDCANRGAGVYQVKGTLTVNGIIKNCDTASNGRGGAICGDSTGTTNLAGMITACTATRGSAYFTPGGATLNVYDGAYIFGNECTGDYGTILMVGTTATMNMYGGTITNSVSGDPTVYNMYSNVNVYGGVIENTVTNAIKTYYSTAGTPVVKIYGGAIDGTLQLDKNVICDVYGGSVAAMTVNAAAVPNIYNAVLGFDPTTLTSATNNVAACSVLSDSHLAVMHAEGTCATCGHTFVKSGDTVCATCNVVHTLIPCAHAFGDSNTCSVCGLVDSYVGGACAHGCENPVWVRWDGTDITAAGHYYVADDMAMPHASCDISEVEGNVCLDLNGKTVTAGANSRAFKVYMTTFNLMDSSAEKTGKIVGNGVLDTNNFGLVYVNSATLNMYDCTISGGHLEYGLRYNDDGLPYAYGQGGNMYINNGVVNMYGTATIKDGVAGYRAGNVNLNTSNANSATLNMYDNSKILDGRIEVQGELVSPEVTSARAANVYVSSDTYLNLYDNATISGGEGGLDDCYVFAYDNGNDADRVSAITMYGGNMLTLVAATDAEIVVKAGTLIQNPIKYVDEAVVLNDVSEGKWIVSDFTTALEASGEGDTITLGMDVKDDGDIELKAGVTLDLNGKNLVTTGDASFVMIGADVKDSKGTGTLKGATVAFNGNNSMLPITLEGVTKFQPKPPVKSGFTQSEGETRKFAFYFKDKAQDTLIDDALNADGNDLDIQFVIKVNNDEEVAYTLRTDGVDGALQDYVKNFDTKALQLTIDGLQETDVVTCEVRVASNGAYVDTVTE